MAKKQNNPPQHQPSQPGKEYMMHPQPEFIKPGYKSSGKLVDKVALITGGDSGIGRAVAVHFAREGADISISYLPEEEKDAKLTQQLVENEGRECLLLPGNLHNKKFCEKLVRDAYSYYKKINILVNNAAEQHSEEDFEKLSDENMIHTFETNIFSFMRITKAVLAHMKEGDCIINTTSVTSYRGSPALIDYSSTKGAITAFTRALSGNLAKKGIRVNGVAPGPIWTPLIPATFDKEKVKGFGTDVPLGRVGQPSEVAPAYVFLASEDSTYFTGQILHPNGGVVINA